MPTLSTMPASVGGYRAANPAPAYWPMSGYFFEVRSMMSQGMCFAPLDHSWGLLVRFKVRLAAKSEHQL
jgi:hypothetical protein